MSRNELVLVYTLIVLSLVAVAVSAVIEGPWSLALSVVAVLVTGAGSAYCWRRWLRETRGGPAR